MFCLYSHALCSPRRSVDALDDASLSYVSLWSNPLVRMGRPRQSSELRYTANTQLEHLHARYTGTIHADTHKHEWITHQHRDTAASIVGHPQLHSYLALADGECKERVRFELCEVRVACSIPAINNVADADADVGASPCACGAENAPAVWPTTRRAGLAVCTRIEHALSLLSCPLL